MKDEMATELDMTNRDPHDLHSDSLKVSFEDVLAEPEGIHSADCVWNCSYKCYNGGKNCCYMVLTYICAIPLALCWGCNFACLAFCHIWQLTPQLRCFQIELAYCQKIWAACVQCYCNPICEAFGLCFSRVKVQNA